MKLVLTAIGGLVVSTCLAQAGGIDRSVTNYGVLFDKGRVLTFGMSSVTPSVSGVYPSGSGIDTGNMSQDYSTYTFSYKADLNDKISYALIVSQPYGADAKYTAVYTGLEAHWQSDQIVGLLKYKLNDRFSVYGGLRYVTSSATIAIPASSFSPFPLGNYTATTDSDSKLGYVVGAAYEIPDIALRAALTYESAITHSFATQERFANLSASTTAGTAEITVPQSVALDFQSGIAKDTLLFGSVRWSEWSAWHVRPSYYDSVVHKEITGFSTNVVAYQLGIGRKINENLSLFIRAGYEASDGLPASKLAPTDGRSSVGVGGSWTHDNMKVTAGVEYVKLGDTFDDKGTKFTGNSALGIGISVAFTF